MKKSIKCFLLLQVFEILYTIELIKSKPPDWLDTWGGWLFCVQALVAAILGYPARPVKGLFLKQITTHPTARAAFQSIAHQPAHKGFT